MVRNVAAPAVSTILFVNLVIFSLLFAFGAAAVSRFSVRAPSCDGPFGRYTGSVGGAAPDCDAGCGSSAPGSYRAVTVDGNVLIDGRRPDRPGVYCVRSDVSVIACNTATAFAVKTGGGGWSCYPRWPQLFGGRDGGDVLACGGEVYDNATGETYKHRLPAPPGLPAIVDPYTDRTVRGVGGGGVYRFTCVPGKYTGGPRDYMGNRFLESPFNRFQRIRDGCARYVYGAVDRIRFSETPGHCDCLPGHGDAGRTLAATASSTAVALPHPCSPCTYGGGLMERKFTVSFPRRCSKAFQRYFEPIEGETAIDTFPCGSRHFSEPSDACVRGRVFVGRGLSEFSRRLIGDEML